MTAAPQLMRSTNGFNKVATNTDGSIDLYFGPQKPANVADSNSIQTADGRDFLVALRLYGTGVEFYDQSWKPDDVVKVKLPLFPTALLRYATAASARFPTVHCLEAEGRLRGRKPKFKLTHFPRAR